MGSGQWYFTRVEIQNKSPSRSDGISLKKESGVRQSYCLFLRELGAKLQLPAHTVSYAILLCHQFFMRQSLAKNDWQIVANSSMLVACKFQETLKPLNDIVFVGYEIAHKSDPSALQRIRHTEVFRKQRELILLGEIIVLQTIGFDRDRIKLPYTALLAGLKCFNIGASSDIGKLAWCLVDVLVRSTMSLEFKPNCLAAGSVAIAAELLHVKQQNQMSSMENICGMSLKLIGDTFTKLLEGCVV